MITPDGTAHQRTTLFTSAVLAADLPLRTDRTIADRVGSWPEYLAGAVLVLMLVLLGPRADTICDGAIRAQRKVSSKDCGCEQRRSLVSGSIGRDHRTPVSYT